MNQWLISVLFGLLGTVGLLVQSRFTRRSIKGFGQGDVPVLATLGLILGCFGFAWVAGQSFPQKIQVVVAVIFGTLSWCTLAIVFMKQRQVRLVRTWIFTWFITLALIWWPMATLPRLGLGILVAIGIAGSVMILLDRRWLPTTGVFALLAGLTVIDVFQVHRAGTVTSAATRWLMLRVGSYGVGLGDIAILVMCALVLARDTGIRSAGIFLGLASLGLGLSYIIPSQLFPFTILLVPVFVFTYLASMHLKSARA